MIDISEKQLLQIRSILKENAPDFTVWAFGSRVNGTVKKFSDLDIVIIGEPDQSSAVAFKLTESFQNSDLPFRVDVLDWNVLSPEFKKVIVEKGYEVLK